MRFKARYQSIRLIEGKHIDYFRTIDADSLPEADKIARQYQRRHYQLISVKQDYV